jgi:hypothetical protein
LLPSNLGQRSAPVARANINDLLGLANQVGLNNLADVNAAFPQYAVISDKVYCYFSSKLMFI